jgi:sulfur carrier protein ThiS
MKIFIEKEQKNIEIDFEGNIKELLKKLDINIETVIVIKNDELLNETDELDNLDSIKIISVVSGG